MKRQTIFIQLAVILAIIVVVNLISGNLYFRLDFTADKRYTLSNATKDILTELEDVITVKAFFFRGSASPIVIDPQRFQGAVDRI